MLAAVCPIAAQEQSVAASLRFAESQSAEAVSNLAVERSGDILIVKGDVNLAGQPVGINREVWIEPVIASGDSTLSLPTVVVAGKYRYLHGLRHATARARNLTLIERKQRNQTVEYSAQVPYSPWMDGATLSVNLAVKGCCSAERTTTTATAARMTFAKKTFKPVFNWVSPTEETVKTREILGQAFIDFLVGKSEIYPDYRSNADELAKIRATIDTVRSDADVTLSSLSIHGFASPEGSYALNERLARERTEALKSYVKQLYHFAPGLISTESTPEDWAGLRQWLEQSSLPDATDIIAIIDSPRDPDAREWLIKSKFPETYADLKENVYPSLRHSDYRIEYTVRAFTTVDEIIRVAQTHPQNLSLAELFTGAKNQPEGSKLYNDLFETAARMYPESEIANINAANAAMQRGDLDSAARYLSRAGDGGEAIYARGNLEALRGNYDAAATLFQQAARLKVADAPAALAQLAELEKN